MLQLQLTVTLGDLIVAGATVAAIVGSYYAVKAALHTVIRQQRQLFRLLKALVKIVSAHGEAIGALEQQTFGERRTTTRRLPDDVDINDDLDDDGSKEDA